MAFSKRDLRAANDITGVMVCFVRETLKRLYFWVF